MQRIGKAVRALRTRVFDFDFNAHQRDVWVEAQARTLARGSRVLDVGAGPCRYKPLFAHCEYKTQDFCGHAPTAAAGLMTETSWEYGAIDYVCDAAHIPVSDGWFDAVLCTEVLEHVPDPAAVVRELGRILRPDGKLFLTAPLGSGVHQEPDHYFGGFTPYWYKRYLREAGFEDIEVVPNGGFFKNYAQESRRFSALIDPRRVPPAVAPLIAPLWVMTLPWFRVALPLACQSLDRLDEHRGFTVGYHVTARRSVSAASTGRASDESAA
jgi:SAM-dependent methyltransferase